MSHTLHRSGSEESLRHDFTILAMGAKGYNREGCASKLLKVGEIFLKHNPVNIGILGMDGQLTADRLKEAEKTVLDNALTHAVFSNSSDLVECLKELREADLGISIVVSGLFDEVHQCCYKAGIEPHTVNLSLGIWGNIDENLPADQRIIDISTMCGHGMIPFTLVEDMVKRVKAGRLTPEQAAAKMAPQCHCHVFNTERASRIIADIVRG